MGNTHESPSGQALRQRELQRHTPFGISYELRTEEGRLLQVLSNGHLVSSLTGGFLIDCHTFSLHIGRNIERTDLGISRAIHNGFLNIGGHGCRINYGLDGSAPRHHLIHRSAQSCHFHVMAHEYRHVEIAEAKRTGGLVHDGRGAIEIHTRERAEAPAHRGCRQPHMRLKKPVVRI